VDTVALAARQRAENQHARRHLKISITQRMIAELCAP
jgi:hypothetical protein